MSKVTTTASPSDAGAPVGEASPQPTADALLTADVVKSKSVGHTSYVLKVTLAGGVSAVFKPRSRRPLGDRRYRGEIAAYRLASALGLDNVPRAEPRAFAASSLRAVQPDFDANARPDGDGRIRGAIMPWIDHYEELPLETARARATWEPLLTDARKTIPDDSRALAGSLSTLVAFDYVTGNWDRWSGGNLARDGATGTVLYVDNDGAFFDPPPEGALARQLAFLQRVVRFSRSFVDRLRALDETKLLAAFGEERAGEPLLPERVVTQVNRRRQTVVDLVDARLRESPDGSDAAVFVFE